MSHYGSQPILKYDGGYNPRDGRVYRCVWEQVWDTCQGAGLTPTELVDTRFRSALSAKAPEPTDLLDSRILQAAVRARATVVKDAEMVFATQLDMLVRSCKLYAQLGRADPFGAAAFTRDAACCPLARYVFVSQAGRTDLADELFPGAVAEFALRRATYERFVLPFLPAAVVQAADRLYADARTVPAPPADAGRMGFS